MDKKGGEDSLDSTKVSSLTAFSQMPTAQHDSTGRLETGATIRTAASNIMSSKSTPSDLQAHQNRSRRALALARKLAMAPGAPLMSPGISPGSPPSGYRRDTKGWHPPTARAGPMNCVPYPRSKMRPVAEPIRPIPEPEWWKELEDYKSRPVGQLADIIPQVQWRDAREYLQDCKKGTRFPLCTYLAI